MDTSNSREANKHQFTRNGKDAIKSWYESISRITENSLESARTLSTSRSLESRDDYTAAKRIIRKSATTESKQQKGACNRRDSSKNRNASKSRNASNSRNATNSKDASNSRNFCNCRDKT